MPRESLKTWYRELPEIAYSLRTTPCFDNHVSPGDLVFGRKMRNPHLKVAHPLEGYDPLTVEENRHEGRRDREMDRTRRMSKELGQQPRRSEQTFAAGDFVRMRAETPIAEAKRRGVPLKWVYRWDERGQ